MNEYKLGLTLKKNETKVTIDFTIEAKTEEGAIWIAKNIMSKTTLEFIEVKYIELVPKKEKENERKADVGDSSSDSETGRETNQNKIPSCLG